MGVYCTAVGPNDERLAGARVGTNACQSVWIALWLAAYAADRRPEANRVCAWVDNGWGYSRSGNKSYPPSPFYTGPDAPPRIERNRPSTVQPWIDFNFVDTAGGADECTALCVQEYTMRLGMKMKSVKDPALADLITVFDESVREHEMGTVAADVVARVAVTFEELLPRLAKSSWYETCAETTAVFRAAADAGGTVRIG